MCALFTRCVDASDVVLAGHSVVPNVVKRLQHKRPELEAIGFISVVSTATVGDFDAHVTNLAPTPW